jgi:tRNA threonylcarbamoyladenosine biosynthesis protein TsaE
MTSSQSSETVKLASAGQESTLETGLSLAKSLYVKDTTIWLNGELGAGKTTFVQGLGIGLGLGNKITSPTYALENRYDDKLLHADLYRLDPDEAKRIMEESGDFPGVRAVEWSERVKVDKVGKVDKVNKDIEVLFKETSPNERDITITFCDVNWPDRETIEKWREEVRLPEHVQIHCDTVGKLAYDLAQELLKQGTVVRPEAVKKAGELHDLFRFVDFSQRNIPHAKEPDTETKNHWEELSKKYPGSHEEACAGFLRDKGFGEIATIIQPHGLKMIDSAETTEQKLLFYADKRVKFDQIVSLDERFDDFAERYGNGKESAQAKEWRKKTKEMERELFPNKPTSL